ncbi:MAG: hypothetical protein R3242_03365 [Akkermansiaceae bacterium]|nr:hypothetical protein [Akkermansiaceae bacterium]
MIDSITLACSTCRNTTIVGGGQAAEWSIFFLFCIIAMVLATVGYSMVRLAKRSRQYADPTLSDDWDGSSDS